MKNLRKKFGKVLSNQRGQGMVEYILLLVVVIALIFAFKPRIMKALEDRTGEVEGGMEQFKIQ